MSEKILKKYIKEYLIEEKIIELEKEISELKQQLNGEKESKLLSERVVKIVLDLIEIKEIAQNKINELYSCDVPEPFYKIKYSKPNWIPKDIDDYFRYIPNDLPRIKYERLIEESNKQFTEFQKDWNWVFNLIIERWNEIMFTEDIVKLHKLNKKWQKK